MNRVSINRSAIDEMDKLYRVNFINSLPGFKSLNLIGTVDSGGQTNLSIVSTVTHFGSSPPLLGYVSRPESADRHTLANIREVGSYSINQVAESFYEKAHQTSARYPRQISEFDAVDLTATFHDSHQVPFVGESPISSHLKLIDIIEIPANGTVLVLGEVTHVYVDSELIGQDGYIDLEAAKTVTGSALDGYHQPARLARLSYAKPDKPLTEI